MALQSSGQISLNDLHVEAGGTSGTQASMNDSDIRGLLNASANSQMTFSGFYGASSSVHSSTITIGLYDNTSNYAGLTHGYNDMSGSGFGPFDYGSLTSTSFSGSSGSSVERVTYNNVSLLLIFVVGSTSVLLNSGWSTLQIGSTSFSRSAASFSSSTTSNSTHNAISQWTWGVNTNPIGTSGTNSITVN